MAKDRTITVRLTSKCSMILDSLEKTTGLNTTDIIHRSLLSSYVDSTQDESRTLGLIIEVLIDYKHSSDYNKQRIYEQHMENGGDDVSWLQADEIATMLTTLKDEIDSTIDISGTTPLTASEEISNLTELRKAIVMLDSWLEE